jgi:hypothetical protein
MKVRVVRNIYCRLDTGNTNFVAMNADTIVNGVN